MKAYIVILMIVFTVSCDNVSYPIEENAPQLYDLYKYKIYEDDTVTIARRIPKYRTIYPAGRMYVYEAIYIGVKGDTLSREKVEWIATGKRTDFAPDRQDVLIYKYYHTIEDSIRFVQSPTINKTIDYSVRWKNEKIEGVIENTEKVWLHPMRHNQYAFTQVAPYPNIYYPLCLEKKWKNRMEMLGGQGDWSYAKIQCDYEITDSITKFYPKIGNLKCWKINSIGSFKMGTSTLQYLFNEQYGFTELHYVNYIGEKLSVVLKAVWDED